MPKRHETIRWTVERAAQEFGVDHRGLASALRRGGHEPKDGCWTTRQVAAAAFGDLEMERTREARHRANLLELDELEKRKQLGSVVEFKAWIERTLVPMKATILQSHLEPDVKEEILKALQKDILSA